MGASSVALSTAYSALADPLFTLQARPGRIEMQKVLIISYMFPPVGGGGAQRITKFSKYLPNFGIKPIVLTVLDALYSVKDPSLLDEIQGTEIIRIGYFDPALWFKNKYWRGLFAYLIYKKIFVPDVFVPWMRPAISKAVQIIRDRKIEVILTSSYAYTDHLIAYHVKRKTGVKWVADFRDEWFSNVEAHYPSRWHKNMTQQMEKKVILAADRVLSVTEPITDYFRTLSQRDKFITLPNGFDPADFKNITRKKHKKFEIVYTGAFYGNRNANAFNEAVAELNLPDLKTTFLGSAGRRVGHYESLQHQVNADVLLLVLGANDPPAVMTGKIFEYLASRRPILCLAPVHTAAAKLIKRLKVGIVVHPTDKPAIKRAIYKLYNQWQKKELTIPYTDISQFDREQNAGKLAKILKELSPERKPILCLIGDLGSIHNIRWANFFKDKYEVHFISTADVKLKGVKVHYLGSQRGFLKPMPLYFLAKIFQVRRLIREIKPDIVHGQYLLVNGVWGALSGFHPLVITAWGSDVLLLKTLSKLKQWLGVQALKKADVITYDSMILGRKVKELSGKTQGLYEIQFGVDTDKFKFSHPDLTYRKKLGFKTTDKIIFCPRGLSELYNTDILIESFAKLAQRIPDLKLLLLKFNADPSYFKRLKDLIEILDLTHRVVFLDSVSQDEIVKLYHLSEVVVSIPSSDSSPVSVLEAMATGKKIVLTDLPYVKEWLNVEKNNFYLVKTRDIIATGQAIKKALVAKNFKVTQKFNREIIMQKADHTKNLEEMDKVYQKLIEGDLNA